MNSVSSATALSKLSHFRRYSGQRSLSLRAAAAIRAASSGMRSSTSSSSRSWQVSPYNASTWSRMASFPHAP